MSVALDPGLIPFSTRAFNPPAGPVRFESTIRPADEPTGSFEALFPDRTLPIRPPPTAEFVPRVGTAIRRLTEPLRWMLLTGDFCRWPPNFCPPMPDTRGANDGDERKFRETPPDIPPDSRAFDIPEPAMRPLDIRDPDMPELDMREPENDRRLLPNSREMANWVTLATQTATPTDRFRIVLTWADMWMFLWVDLVNLPRDDRELLSRDRPASFLQSGKAEQRFRGE